MIFAYLFCCVVFVLIYQEQQVKNTFAKGRLTFGDYPLKRMKTTRARVWEKSGMNTTVAGKSQSVPPERTMAWVANGSPDAGGPPPTGTEKTTVMDAKNLVIENNIIDVPTADNAVRISSTDHRTVFNNRSSLGVFLPAYNASDSLHIPELTTDAQTMVYSL